MVFKIDMFLRPDIYIFSISYMLRVSLGVGECACVHPEAILAITRLLFICKGFTNGEIRHGVIIKRRSSHTVGDNHKPIDQSICIVQKVSNAIE